MKYIRIILFLLITSSCKFDSDSASLSYIKEKCKTDYKCAHDYDEAIRTTLVEKCEEDTLCYINSAKTDFKNNNLRWFIMGLIDGGLFQDHYGVCLETKKGINVIQGGDMDNIGLRKYNETMIGCIKEKYGNDFLIPAKRLQKF